MFLLLNYSDLLLASVHFYGTIMSNPAGWAKRSVENPLFAKGEAKDTRSKDDDSPKETIYATTQHPIAV
jgi:hypothetical protein